MLKFKMYDVVLVVRLPTKQGKESERGVRPVRIGDRGTIVMVYRSPEDYTVEDVAKNGNTEWISDFSPDELEMA